MTTKAATNKFSPRGALAHPGGKTCSLLLSSSWLHPLRSWSLRQTRRGSKREDDPDAAVLPILRDVSNPWDMTKDGRSWFGRHLSELMRK